MKADDKGTHFDHVRMRPTEPNMAFAGVMFETSFARFMASMAAFNVEKVTS